MFLRAHTLLGTPKGFCRKIFGSKILFFLNFSQLVNELQKFWICFCNPSFKENETHASVASCHSVTANEAPLDEDSLVWALLALHLR